jgi:CheY-like chemotaxis protein
MEGPMNKHNNPDLCSWSALAGRLVGHRVLLIEDDPLIALHLTEAMEDGGATVITADAIEPALVVIAQQQISAAVVDVHLRAQRADVIVDALEARGVPFLFYTGYEPDELPCHIPIVRKPSSSDEVIRTLEILMAPISSAK